MYVAIDSNIWLQDPWLESRRMSALYDFIGKTRGKLLVHDVVLTETRAELQRRWGRLSTDLSAIERQATRLKFPLPELGGVTDRVAEVSREWEENFRQFHPYLTRGVQSAPELLTELVHRAAYRIPPCSTSGEEMRDALIWLGILRHCAENGWREVAFISANKRDFADADGQLISRLRQDAVDHGLDLRYYTSLDDFLKDQAEPIAHVTVDWINQRLDENEVAEFVEGAVQELDWEDLLPWSEQGEGWDPYSGPEIESIALSLDDVYVWRRSDEGIEVFLDYHAQLDGRVDCEREDGDPERGYWSAQRSFSKTIQRIVYVSARLREDEIELIEVDRVERA